LSFELHFPHLIPKKQDSKTSNDYRPVSCCNMFYKLVAKLLSIRLKPILSEEITKEQFKFLCRRQIHDVISIAQNVMHSVKLTNNLATILKLGLSKPYDRINWTFLRLILIKMGIHISSINWIMGRIESALFTIMINGSPSNFFQSSRGLKQGCPLSPFLFLIIVDTLRRLFCEVRSKGDFRGVKIIDQVSITHPLHG
jgi:hypothetical protein